jgi:hypothetical protein
VTWTLPDADGTDGQVIKTNGTGTLSWITPSAGGGGGGTSVTVTQITATAAQTDFSVTYTVGQLSVYLNGALLASADYTASNGTTVVLAAGAASGDIFTALAYDSATQITEGDSTVEVTDTGSNGTATFTMDGTVRAKVNQYGLGLGTETPSSGMGIKFPVTQSASSDANTLDDYEQGSWTPAWAFSTSGSAPLVVQHSQYTKIGRLVTVSARFYTSPTSSPTGNATITGLPFTSSSQIGGVVGEALRWATAMTTLRVNTVASQSYLEFSKNATDSGGVTSLAGSDFNSTDVQNIINITVTYIT